MPVTVPVIAPAAVPVSFVVRCWVAGVGVGIRISSVVAGFPPWAVVDVAAGLLLGVCWAGCWLLAWRAVGVGVTVGNKSARISISSVALSPVALTSALDSVLPAWGSLVAVPDAVLVGDVLPAAVAMAVARRLRFNWVTPAMAAPADEVVVVVVEDDAVDAAALAGVAVGALLSLVLPAEVLDADVLDAGRLTRVALVSIYCAATQISPPVAWLSSNST